MKKLSKKEAEKQIEKFFSKIEDKTPKEIRKMKKFAMRHSIKLGEFRKKFCKKCLEAYKNPSIRIKNRILSIICENCGNKSRWKVK
jgi:RNase P subunit RPR2